MDTRITKRYSFQSLIKNKWRRYKHTAATRWFTQRGIISIKISITSSRERVPIRWVSHDAAAAHLSLNVCYSVVFNYSQANNSDNDICTFHVLDEKKGHNLTATESHPLTTHSSPERCRMSSGIWFPLRWARPWGTNTQPLVPCFNPRRNLYQGDKIGITRFLNHVTTDTCLSCLLFRNL